MKSTPQFTGFPPEGIRFLRDLMQHNEKSWFEAHRAEYEAHVQAPAVALVAALGGRLQAEFPAIDYDTRANGRGSLMRIYRDVRFSADKRPYKTNVAMMFTPQGTKRMEAPGFGLQITPERAELVAGVFGFSKPQLKAFRAAVDDDGTGQALATAVSQIEAAGAYEIGGKALKQGPRGYALDHPRIEWLKYKGLHVYSPTIPLQIVYTAALVDVAMDHFRNMAPIYSWLMQILDV